MLMEEVDDVLAALDKPNSNSSTMLVDVVLAALPNSNSSTMLVDVVLAALDKHQQ